MGGSGSNVGLLPEYKYLKFPPERLISGFLTVIVQNSDYSEGDDFHDSGDQMQRIRSGWGIVPDNAKKTFPFGRNVEDGSAGIEGIQPPEGELAGDRTSDIYGGGGHPQNHFDRVGMAQSGGDFDVFVYVLTANFHINNKVLPSSLFSIPAAQCNWIEEGYWEPENAYKGYYLSSADLHTLGCADTTADRWAFEFDHFGCQSFVRSTLIARHNNAYQHDWHNGPDFISGSRYYNYRNSGIPQKEWHINKDIPASDWFVSTDDDGNLSSTPENPGRPKVDKRMFQNGVFSPSRWDPRGVVIPEGGWAAPEGVSFNLTDSEGTGNVGIDLSESAVGSDGSTPRGNNTFFSPVYDIQIYGQHPLALTKFRTGTTPNTASNLITPADTFSPVKVLDHPEDWWQLVIEVNKWGYDADGTAEPDTDVDADRSYIKTRTNIFYQPFGETQQFEFSNAIHT